MLTILRINEASVAAVSGGPASLPTSSVPAVIASAAMYIAVLSHLLLPTCVCTRLEKQGARQQISTGPAPS